MTFELPTLARDNADPGPDSRGVDDLFDLYWDQGDDKEDFETLVKRKKRQKEIIYLPPLPVEERRSSASSFTILDRARTVSFMDSKFNVDHTHYEKWARVPSKRPPPNLMFRGIYQSNGKSRNVDKEEGMKCNTELNKENSVVVKPAIQREKSVFQKQSQIDNIRREKTESAQVERSERERGLHKPMTKRRSPIKLASAHISTLDSNLAHFTEHQSIREQKVDPFLSTRDFRLRMGQARIRDRCPLPLSINSPRCVGDHVFLINEPLKHPHVTKEGSKSNLKDLPPSKPEPFVEWPDPGWTVNGRDRVNGVETMLNRDDQHPGLCTSKSFERSKSLFGSFAPRKLVTYRTPAVVASAELFDFSSLVELANSSTTSSTTSAMDSRSTDRQRTEIALRGSRLVQKLNSQKIQDSDQEMK